MYVLEALDVYVVQLDARDDECWVRLFEAQPKSIEGVNWKATAMWTDPPFGVAYEGKTKDKLTIKNDDRVGLKDMLAQAFPAVDRMLAPGSPFYIAAPSGPQLRTSHAGARNCH